MTALDNLLFNESWYTFVKHLMYNSGLLIIFINTYLYNSMKRITEHLLNSFQVLQVDK